MASLSSQGASSGPQVVDLSQSERDAPQTGRKPSEIRSSEFKTVGNSNNKSKRPGAQCKHCDHVFSAKEATTTALQKHITSECTRVPKDTKRKWQLQAAGQQASSTAGEQAVLAGKRKQRQFDIGRYVASSEDIDPQSWELTAEEKKQISFSLLRFAVTADVAFTQMSDNPHLKDALQKMRPHYQFGYQQTQQLPPHQIVRMQQLQQLRQLQQQNQ